MSSSKEAFGLVCCMIAAGYLGLTCGGGPAGAVMAAFLVGYLGIK